MELPNYSAEVVVVVVVPLAALVQVVVELVVLLLLVVLVHLVLSFYTLMQIEIFFCNYLKIMLCIVRTKKCLSP